MSHRTPPYPSAVLLLCAAWLVCASAHAQIEANAASSHQPAHDRDPELGVVNINTASSDELERLPGIGPTRARAILALRARMSRFTRSEELLRVKGIGRATYRKLRALVVLTGETTLVTPPPRRSAG